MAGFGIISYKPFAALAVFTALCVFGITGRAPGAAAQTGDKEAQAQTPPPQIKPVIDPEAEQLLKDMSDTLKKARTFTVRAEIDFDKLLPSGQLIKRGGTVNLTVGRPDKVYAVFDWEPDDKKIWLADNLLTMLDVNTNFYGTLKTPPTIDETMDHLIDDYGFTLPLADILSSDPYESFTASYAAGVVVGDAVINGRECRHLAFVEKYIDWQIWISGGAQSLPCRLVITYKTMPGGPQYSAVFSHWNLNPAIDPSVFRPEIPGDAVKIDFLGMKGK